MVAAAIVVQNFNKPDTLDALCKTLLECDSRQQFDLIFWSDSAAGARKESEYGPKCAEVERLLAAFASAHGGQFRSITLRRNPVNFGCYKTCQIALDSVFEDHDFVVFSEDDTIFAPDALDWFTAMAATPQFRDDNVWAISGESIFFDAQRATPEPSLVEAARRHAVHHRLWEQFIPFDWVPSTCFATNRQKWAQYSTTRGEPVGDVILCKRCRDEGKKCLFPVVARVKDVGMLHPDGYSVLIHTKENVQSIKNCYLLSGDIRRPSDAKLRPFDGEAGRLFWQSTLLNGFERGPNDRTEQAVPADRRPVPTLEAARKAGADADWGLALQLWLALKEGRKGSVEVDTNIGLCLLKTGKHAEARIEIQAVLATHPDEPFAQIIMAHILEAAKDFTAAAHIWNKLRNRDGLPEWMYSSAVDGESRSKAAAIAQKF
jgi:hypothetical protein